MDAEEARNSLEQARRSYSASVRPPLPAWAPPVCGAMYGAAVALVGQAPGNGWVRLAATLIGLALALGAWAVVVGIRARQGVRGLRGPARRTQAALVAGAAAFLVSALNSTPELRWLYVAMGVAVAGLAWYLLQRKVQ
ncbi:hypothetical protein AB0A69_10465 [Streptomyces sp. NPDC045431]|uniref:hypothetical protein n=1 Tax=Streptomyces sp. NPDC045431 TaxID=3155613 RepID=UPI00340FE45C